MPAPTSPYRPYLSVHKDTKGPGDARPTALQVIKDCNKIGALKGKTALVTGCSSGLGVETARALYEAGATVFCTARNIPKLESVIEDIVSTAQHNKDGPRPQALEIHLDDLASVRAGVEAFKAKSNTLNILITNAGVMASPYGKTKDGFETQIGTNHFGHFLLLQLLKPVLLATAKSSGTQSRFVSVSSAGHRRTTVIFKDKAGLDAWNSGKDYDKWVAYGQAKTANIWTANSTSRHYAAQGLIGISLHPGGIRTELDRHMSKEDWDFVKADQWEHIFKSPEQGAATQVWAAVTDHFECKEGAVYCDDVGEAVPMTPSRAPGAPGYVPHAYDEAGEENLWKLSHEVLGLTQD